MKTCNFCNLSFGRRYAESHKEYDKRKFCCKECANKAKTGRKTTEETKEKLRLLAIGRKNSEESKLKVSGEKSYRWKGGKPKCVECGTTLASVYATKCTDCYKKTAIGENSAHWKGGITPINTAIRNSKNTKDWRISVFERDNYTCQLCKTRGGKLHAHHIMQFSKYPELRFTLSNGQTLCKDCHKMVHLKQYNESAIIKGAIA